ncbi:TetR/AcrR family transcriptional regulator (plasmid) [Streptomyces sp. NBC_00637]|uniref:TetR/AcrR family transcriptional regulator n=1 Tax=Streptomyces sp. NBC_00637 TaxID=2903667 RepID=UPI002F91A32A
MGRRGDTRQRIQDVALELFAEHGYEKTSLREIAEHLDVTKAALYYHFKAKEDILVSLFDDLGRPVDELIEWGKRQLGTLDTKRELLARYSLAVQDAIVLFRFMQENQATIRELGVGEAFRDRMLAMIRLLCDGSADLTARVRCTTALVAMHAGVFALEDVEGDPEEKRRAILEVAQELVSAAHPTA